MKNNILILFSSLYCLAFSSITFANENHSNGYHQPFDPGSHAPIGVMGEHMHQQGEWMVSYRYMSMNMEDNIKGSDSVSPNTIVTTLANPFPGPATTRVVPLDMQTNMHMIGLMYAPTDNLTLMTMLNFVEKEMKHLTYMGMMGTTTLGTFSTQSSGIGDTKVSALIRLPSIDTHQFHLNVGVSLPTGSIDKNDKVLTPMNTRPTLRMPYAMQLGSGTYDLEPGITYNGQHNKLRWGGQYLATLRMGENRENYALGDIHQLSLWSSYRFATAASSSLRLTYKNEDTIRDRDDKITAPVQTANPDNNGGELFTLGLGVNLVGQNGAIRGHRVALEYQTVLHHHAHGVQMEMQDMLTAGYQYAF